LQMLVREKSFDRFARKLRTGIGRWTRASTFLCVTRKRSVLNFKSREDTRVILIGIKAQGSATHKAKASVSVLLSSPRASSNASSCGRLSPILAVFGEPDWTPTYAPSYSPEQQLGKIFKTLKSRSFILCPLTSFDRSR